MKKKWIAVCMAAVCAAALVTGCSEETDEPEPVAVKEITLNKTTLTLAPDGSEPLTATVKPDDADDKTVAWSSSDNSIATVSSDGTVTARAEGTATITATAGGKTATCEVTVNPAVIAVTGITLDEETLALTIGTTGTLTATVKPDDADDKTVTWSSDNTEVATVDNNGTVTAVKKGTATITAQAGSQTATCKVTVTATVAGISLDEETLTLARGTTGTLTATLTAEDTDGVTVAWSSSDKSVATVDNDGTVTAVKKGTATITAQAGGQTATCEVTVFVAVDGITLSLTRSFPVPDTTRTLTAKVTPDDADDKTVTWSSSDESVATVEDGTFTAHKVGTATITAQAGGKTATCEVTVHVHSYSGGKCTVCGAKPSLTGATIDNDGVLTKYSGSAETVDIPDGVTGIGKSAFYNVDKYLTTVTIPDSVTSIGESAFSHCWKLTSVTIGNGVTSIGNNAFYNCNRLTSVTIPDSVTSIGNDAFDTCSSLTSVTIGDGVTKIGDYAFSRCTRLTEMKIGNSVTSIGNKAFYDCDKLRKIQFGGTVAQWEAIDGKEYVLAPYIECTDGYIGVKNVPDYLTFYGTTVTGYTDADAVPENLEIPDGVTSIEFGAFRNCRKLTSVTIPNGVTEIGDYAFRSCSNLTSVTMGDDVTKIGDYAFQSCSNLTSVTMGDNVTKIGEYAFYECSRLESVEIPTSVKSIEFRAFLGCRIGTVYYAGTEAEWEEIDIHKDSGLSNKKIICTDSDVE